MAERAGQARLHAIWRAVRSVPAGRVATYGEIAEQVGDGCTARQVGAALRRSPKSLRLPWHRIIAAGGRIALPGEAGVEQRLRLESEGVQFRGRKVRIESYRGALNQDAQRAKQ